MYSFIFLFQIIDLFCSYLRFINVLQYDSFISIRVFISSILGIRIKCAGDPGHGSRFIENTAAEKLVSLDLFLSIAFK